MVIPTLALGLEVRQDLVLWLRPMFCLRIVLLHDSVRIMTCRHVILPIPIQRDSYSALPAKPIYGGSESYKSVNKPDLGRFAIGFCLHRGPDFGLDSLVMHALVCNMFLDER